MGTVLFFSHSLASLPLSFSLALLRARARTQMPVVDCVSNRSANSFNHSSKLFVIFDVISLVLFYSLRTASSHMMIAWIVNTICMKPLILCIQKCKYSWQKKRSFIDFFSMNTLTNQQTRAWFRHFCMEIMLTNEYFWEKKTSHDEAKKTRKKNASNRQTQCRRTRWMFA